MFSFLPSLFALVINDPCSMYIELINEYDFVLGDNCTLSFVVYLWSQNVEDTSFW